MAVGSAIFFLGVGSAIAQVFGYEIEYHVVKQKLIEEFSQQKSLGITFFQIFFDIKT